MNSRYDQQDIRVIFQIDLEKVGNSLFDHVHGELELIPVRGGLEICWGLFMASQVKTM